MQNDVYNACKSKMNDNTLNAEVEVQVCPESTQPRAMKNRNTEEDTRYKKLYKGQ